MIKMNKVSDKLTENQFKKTMMIMLLIKVMDKQC